MQTEDSLSRKALAGLARFHLAFALLLFLPAWTLAYWQAWLLWLISAVSCLGITLYFLRHDPALIRRRMDVGAKAEQRPRQQQLQRIAGLLLCAIVVVPGIDHRFHWSAVPISVVLVAQLVFALCMLMIFFVFKVNSFTAATVVVEPQQQVVTTGLYGLVRHPMYFASVIAFIAVPLALGSAWAVLLSVPLCASLVLRLLDEEEHLAEALPGYRDYQCRVRYRLLPGIW